MSQVSLTVLVVIILIQTMWSMRLTWIISITVNRAARTQQELTDLKQSLGKVVNPKDNDVDAWGNP